MILLFEEDCRPVRAGDLMPLRDARNELVQAWQRAAGDKSVRASKADALTDFHHAEQQVTVDGQTRFYIAYATYRAAALLVDSLNRGLLQAYAVRNDKRYHVPATYWIAAHYRYSRPIDIPDYGQGILWSEDYLLESMLVVKREDAGNWIGDVLQRRIAVIETPKATREEATAWYQARLGTRYTREQDERDGKAELGWPSREIRKLRKELRPEDEQRPGARGRR